MRKSQSTPTVGGKKKPGSKQEEQKQVSLSKTLAPFESFQSGDNLTTGGYKVGQHIAAGADGDVFRAIWITQKREVAVKRIRVTSAVIQRHVQQEVAAVFHARKCFLEEAGEAAKELAAVGHSAIVGYLDWFAGQGGLDREVYIVMDLCNFGIGDLIHTGHVMRTEYEKMVKKRMPLQMMQAANKGKPSLTNGPDPTLYRFPEREILKILLQMTTALAFLNRHGIFHRDVKSENILWKHDHPNEGVYKLADFGVAFCEADTDTSKKNDDCGTLWTMAPELLGRKPGAGPSCDTWSLACVLFETSFFEKPFNSLELLGYRNGESASLGGFWNSLCGEKKEPAGTKPAGGRWGSSMALGSNPSSPSSTRASPAKGGGSGSCFGRGPSKKLDRQSSLPALAAAKANSGDLSGSSPEKPKSPQGKLSKALSKRSSDSNISAPPPLSLLKQTSSLDEDMMISPSTESAAAEALRQRKRAFLRKRGGQRWIYSDDLRTLIFDDMLDEDPIARPTPGSVLESPKLQGLLASFDVSRWAAADDLARCSSLGVAPTLRPDTAKSEKCTPRLPPAASETPRAQESNEPGSAPVITNGSNAVIAGNALRRLTPEGFLAVLKADRKFDPSVFSQQNYDAPTNDGVLTGAANNESS